MAMNKVNVYILSNSLVKKNFDSLLDYVDISKKEKALKYVQEKDKLLSLGSSYLVKHYLKDKEIKETKTGKPYIEGGPYFNVSHSNEYSVLAITHSNEVGVDIEYIDERKLKAIRGTLNDVESKEVDPSILFRMWSNKESLIKCVGSSLSDIKKVPGLPLVGKKNFDGESFYSKSLVYKGYSLSLSLKNSEEFDVEILELENLEI